MTSSTHLSMGSLVVIAALKNQSLNANRDPSLARIVMQRRIWTQLRGVFMAPGVNVDRLVETPVPA